MPRLLAPWLRPTAWLLATATAWGGAGGVATASAPVQTDPVAADGASEDPLLEAQRLYDRGRAQFETADYGAAIELWTEAYALVPESTQGRQIKVLLLYNLATARGRQFEVSRDPAQLRQAMILLRDFEQSIATLYGEGDEAEAERIKVQEKIAEIERQLAAHDAVQDQDENHEPGPTEPADPTEPTREPTPTDEPARPGRGLVAGGAVAAALGVGGLATMAAGLAIGARANDLSGLDPGDIEGRRARFDRGRTGNTLAVAGVAVGAPLLIAGAVMLAVGLRRTKVGGRTALVPGLAPMRGGPALVLQGRF